MKVAIVGAGGFIGRAMARHVQRAHPEARIVSVVRDPGRAPADLPGTVMGDIPEADLVIYLAGRGGIPESFDDPAGAFQTACREACTAMDRARDLGVGRFVLASTCAVYPHGPAPAREDGPLALKSPYAEAKRAAEIYGLTASDLTGQDIRVVRLANIYGPGQVRQLIHDVAQRARAGGRVSLRSGGAERRDFLHVDDAAQAIWTVATRGRKGAIVNLGSGDPRRVRDVAGLICGAFGATLELPDEEPAAADGAADAFPDVGALFGLGFRPRTGFEDGLAETLEWMRSEA